MTDRPTLAEAQADQFWARPADQISGDYELRFDLDTDTATIWNPHGWVHTGDIETIMEQWDDITHQEEQNDQREDTPPCSHRPDSGREPVPVVGPVSGSDGPDMTSVPDFIDIVFDGPPGPESGRFVEVENSDGASISGGEWLQRDDEFWVLRIPKGTL